ncbi:MAG: G5 domain-containing protein, partial [Symbiobacteriaceae bacterium]|nr:G5 domain-containing protein [Symbiobacteriaceae bacterium]
RVQSYIFSMQYAVPYGIIREESPNLGRGYEPKMQYGQEGVREETVEVRVENGIDVGWTLLKDEVLQDPIHEIIYVGTAGVAVYDEESFPYERLYIIETTGYCSCFICCEKHPGDRGYGITYSGMPQGRGVVGADLSIFPIGTKLYVEGYGYCVVGDTGGALIGRMRIDLGFATHQEAVDWALKVRTPVYLLAGD